MNETYEQINTSFDLRPTCDPLEYMSIIKYTHFKKCVAATNRVRVKLEDLDEYITTRDQQRGRLRDDPARLSQSNKVWNAYLARLHEWYTICLAGTRSDIYTVLYRIH